MRNGVVGKSDWVCGRKVGEDMRYMVDKRTGCSKVVGVFSLLYK